MLPFMRPANGNAYLYDVALAIDFIEHLKRLDAVTVIAHMKRLAPRVAIFTPFGFHPQTEDREHTGADYWQTHRSGWDPDDLTALGFEVEVWEGFHEWGREEYGGDPKWSPDAIWATWR